MKRPARGCRTVPESLRAVCCQLNVDILITGYTHEQSVEQHTGFSGQTKLILNPGSATGAFSGLQG